MVWSVDMSTAAVIGAPARPNAFDASAGPPTCRACEFLFWTRRCVITPDVVVAVSVITSAPDTPPSRKRSVLLLALPVWPKIDVMRSAPFGPIAPPGIVIVASTCSLVSPVCDTPTAEAASTRQVPSVAHMVRNDASSQSC